MSAIAAAFFCRKRVKVIIMSTPTGLTESKQQVEVRPRYSQCGCNACTSRLHCS